MAAPAGFLASALLQYLVICAVFVALCDLARRLLRLDDWLAVCAALLALGTLGYLLFWIALASYAAFSIAKIAVLAALLIHFGAIVYRRRLASYRWLAEPLLYVTLFAVVVLALGFSNGGLDAPGITAQNRFSHPLPIDNLIPQIVAIALRLGKITSPLFGDWLMSDRPPLQTGLYLMLTLQNSERAYQIVCVWLQASFLLGVWGLLVAARLPDSARRTVLLACCLLPTAIINTFFTWPKMLTVTFLLPVFALLFCRTPRDGRERTVFGILIGGLTALAVLSHGSSLFALIGFAVVVVVFWAWPPLRTMLAGFAAIVALYAPWMIYQTVFDPPANRLLKWHFAGVVEVDSRSFGTALREAYGALSWDSYLVGKLENLRALTGHWPGETITHIAGALGYGSLNPAGVRANDFFQLLPSLQAYSFALVCALLLVPFMTSEQRPQRDLVLRIMVALLATLAAFVLMIFQPGQTINHQGTYVVQVLATVVAFTVLALRAPRLAAAFLALQAVVVSVLYAFTVPHDSALWPLLVACVAATLVLVSYSLRRSSS